MYEKYILELESEPFAETPPRPPTVPTQDSVRRQLFREIESEQGSYFMNKILPAAWIARRGRLVSEQLPNRLALEKMRYDAAAQTYQLELSAFEERHVAWRQARHEESVLTAALLASPPSDLTLRMVESVLRSINFEFDSACLAAMQSPDHLFLDIDLPEIEDLMSSPGKSTSSSDFDRYTELVFGHCLNLTARVFCCLPSLAKITLAAYTQRKARTAQDPDSYVVEMEADRDSITAALQSRPRTLKDLHLALSFIDCRYEILANGSLARIPRPEWTLNEPPLPPA
jgi:hypothetical protein